MEQDRYDRALHKVKRMKRFYIHALVYVVVNSILIIESIQELGPDESFWDLKNFSTVFFWGIGLMAHGLSVFLPDIIMGKDWEERKVKEFMEKEKGTQNKWQ